MNPCTIMGGFYFEAGRVLFGVTAFAIFVALIVVAGFAARWINAAKS